MQTQQTASRLEALAALREYFLELVTDYTIESDHFTYAIVDLELFWETIDRNVSVPFALYRDLHADIDRFAHTQHLDDFGLMTFISEYTLRSQISSSFALYQYRVTEGFY